MHTWRVMRSVFTLFLVGLMAVGACKRAAAPPPPIEASAPARRSVMSFVRCVAQMGGRCVPESGKLTGWDAFSVLGWLADGSPLAILRVFRRELERHRDPRKVQGRFVNQAMQLHLPLRGAGCAVESVREIGPLIPDLQKQVETRLTAMGVWHGDLDRVVRELGDQATADLTGGYLVHLECSSDPHTLHAATIQDGERHIVVGMLSGLPRYLGGDTLSAEFVERRLNAKTLSRNRGIGVGVADTAVHPWINIPVKEF